MELSTLARELVHLAKKLILLIALTRTILHMLNKPKVKIATWYFAQSRRARHLASRVSSVNLCRVLRVAKHLDP